jgi:acylphosphatase
MDAPTAIAPVEGGIGVHPIRKPDVSPSAQQDICQDNFTHLWGCEAGRFGVYDSPERHYAIAVEQTAKHVVFTGHVQGVGFRYTALSISRQYPVSGYVRNESDGTVEMIVQGAPADIDNFIQDVRQEFEDKIRETRIEPAPYNPRYTDFRITH